MLGDLVLLDLSRSRSTVTAAGTLSMSTPVPDSGVVEKTSIVGSTTVAPELAGAAEAFWARAEGAPSANPATAVNAKRTRPSLRLLLRALR